jgi:hypothetical protein
MDADADAVGALALCPHPQREFQHRALRPASPREIHTPSLLRDLFLLALRKKSADGSLGAKENLAAKSIERGR